MQAKVEEGKQTFKKIDNPRRVFIQAEKSDTTSEQFQQEKKSVTSTKDTVFVLTMSKPECAIKSHFRNEEMKNKKFFKEVNKCRKSEKSCWRSKLPLFFDGSVTVFSTQKNIVMDLCSNSLWKQQLCLDRTTTSDTRVFATFSIWGTVGFFLFFSISGLSFNPLGNIVRVSPLDAGKEET